MNIKAGYEYTLTRECGDVFVGVLGTKPNEHTDHKPHLIGKFKDESDTNFVLLEDVKESETECGQWEVQGWVDRYLWERKNAVKQWPWMDEDQQLCYFMLCDLYRGAHHVFGKITDGCVGGISICTREHDLATFDYNFLTRAVVMAHDRCIRFSVAPGSGDRLRLHLSKRVRSDDLADMSTRHPTLEEHIEIIRHGK